MKPMEEFACFKRMTLNEILSWKDVAYRALPGISDRQRGCDALLTLTNRHWYLCINNTVTNVKVKFGDGSILSLCL